MDIALVILPAVGGFYIGQRTMASVAEWYPTLHKPAWNPPNAVFGPVWTVLYVLMGYAAYRVFKSGGGGLPLTLFFLHLLLNYAWSIVFFEQRDLRKALGVIVALVVSGMVVMHEFSKYDETAAKLLWPYLAWLAFATALNYEVMRLNA